MFRQAKAALGKLRHIRFSGQQHTWRLKSTSARDRALQYKPGEQIHGFTVREVVAVP
ncbi:Presequence protease, mitochondrial [Larimichthys crocea]|uniref:Uncharacterized protein n=1 Tax=Larimichthys crocea TaxID=215358 RepID=A0ACD3QQX1_LARCR|nr:Presequence protease, mitochondrial [Larimichthys crocea]